LTVRGRQSAAPALRRRFVLALVLVALSPGCASHYSRSADRSVASILSEKSAAVEKDRAAAFVSPRAPVEGEDPSEGAYGDRREAPIEIPPVVRLADALRIAVTTSRDYISRREGLYLSALGLTGTRLEFSPRLSSTLSYIATGRTGQRTSRTGAADLSISQILPTGGNVTVTGRTDITDPGRDTSHDANVGVTLTQPLLAGAGYEASHEALTQAERSMVYDVREFARFREQFLVGVVSDFYQLLAQKERLENIQQRFESVEFQFRRTQALFEVGRQEQIEVLRAEIEVLRVENDLVNERQGFALALDQFKLSLGLPISVELNLAPDPPEFRPVPVSLASAVDAAMANRFDLANAREILEDTERALRIAKQGLLPDLSLTATAGRTAATRDRPLDYRFDDRSRSIGLFLEVPLERTFERNALRRAEIALDRERRAYQGTRDALVVEVRETLRGLRQAEVNLRIQERLIEVEERRVRKATLDFEAGTIGNRDLLEAEQSLLDARNTRIQVLVNYEILRIELERSMGTLEIDDEGGWTPRRSDSPPVEPAEKEAP
jgi:outer membrane protein TolC